MHIDPDYLLAVTFITLWLGSYGWALAYERGVALRSALRALDKPQKGGAR